MESHFFTVAILALTTGVSIAGAQSNSGSGNPSISADGRFVAFRSAASDLVADDTNSVDDVFVHDRLTGETTRVSVGSGGTQANDHSFDPSISADGRFVAFASVASNLAGVDFNGFADVFVHDRHECLTALVSIGTGNETGNFFSQAPSISADGHCVAFHSAASDLTRVDGNGLIDVFVHDLRVAETCITSVSTLGDWANENSFKPSISADGRYVAFESEADNLVAMDFNGACDVFVGDLVTGETVRVSIDSAGIEANLWSFQASISANGRFVAFSSLATDLVDDDVNGTADVFVHDLQTGETTRVSVDDAGAGGDDASLQPSISADGRFVAFNSQASNLVPGEVTQTQVYVHDRQTGQTTLVSINDAGVAGNAASFDASISEGGRFVAFTSQADNLIDNDVNGQDDVFVHDRQTGETAVVPTVLSPCLSDLDKNGMANVFDLLLFLELFDRGDLAADLDTDHLLTPVDVLAFLDRLANGCE